MTVVTGCPILGVASPQSVIVQTGANVDKLTPVSVPRLDFFHAARSNGQRRIGGNGIRKYRFTGSALSHLQQ